MPSGVAWVVAGLILLSSVGWGWLLVHRWVRHLDAAARMGIYTLVGGGALGMCTYFVGRISTAAGVLVVPVGIGLLLVLRKLGSFPKFKTPAGLLLLYPGAVALMALLGLIGALTPSSALDWDTIAYHLAVPKLWIQAGHVSSISFIHHSNFPQCIDGLFLIGELSTDQSASKLTIWGLGLAATLTTFGLIRQQFGVTIGWISATVFASIPMVVWESGTAYIDVIHGIYGGLALVFAARFVDQERREDLLMTAVLLGLSAGSKYTGLQMILISSVIVLVVGRLRVAEAAKLAGFAALLASPWYIKNWIEVGNPVFPFFYGVFGGMNWDSSAAQIYTNEQKSFGLSGLSQIGSSIFGLVFSPGRFTNPQQAMGGGLAFVTLGFLLVPLALVGIIYRSRAKFETALYAGVVAQLGIWLLLSQQSRYILILALPMLFMLARSAEVFPLKRAIPALVAAQVALTTATYWKTFATERLPVLVGGITRDEFIKGYVVDGVASPPKVSVGLLAAELPGLSVKKIALYDEVFGYYLDAPYRWANPGHSTELDYAHIKTVTGLIDIYRKLGISHVYLTNSGLISNESEYLRWLDAAGLGEKPAHPYPADDPRLQNPEAAWRYLIANAIGSGELRVVKQLSRSKLLLELK